MNSHLNRQLNALAPGLPGAIVLENGGEWIVEDGTLAGRAPARTDLFLDPLNPARRELTAPMLLFPAPEQDFLFSARVEVDFRGQFDAGVLVLYQDETNWAKLCLEYSPAREPMVVSVVTKSVSDDCNSVVLERPAVHLRIARIRAGFAFHYSLSGNDGWRMVRAFALGPGATQAGFLVQSPRGEGCTARFSEIRYRSATLGSIRSGE